MSIDRHPDRGSGSFAREKDNTVEVTWILCIFSISMGHGIWFLGFHFSPYQGAAECLCPLLCLRGSRRLPPWIYTEWARYVSWLGIVLDLSMSVYFSPFPGQVNAFSLTNAEGYGTG